MVRVHPPPRRPTSTGGSSSFGRAIAFQAIGGGFEPRLPLQKSGAKAHPPEHTPANRYSKESVSRMTSRSSSVVERFLGKEEVTSPTLVCGSLFMRKQKEKTTKTEDESLVPALFERERK